MDGNGRISRASLGVSRLIDRLTAEEEGRIKPIPLPWPEMNMRIANGLLPGEVTILVGTPGASKSWASLAIAFHAEKHGHPWGLLPLEQTTDVWIRRFLALRKNSWKTLDVNRQQARETKLAILDDFDGIEGLASRVWEYMVDVPDDLEDLDTIPGLSWRNALKHIARHARDGSLVIVDPITKIDWIMDDRFAREHVEQQRFISTLETVIAKTTGHVILIAHIAKRPGRSDKPLALDDVQGSAGFARFARNVIAVENHEPRTSKVWVGYEREMEHERTISILKTNAGSGTGKRFAFDFSLLPGSRDSSGPRLQEYGMIVPKG